MSDTKNYSNEIFSQISKKMKYGAPELKKFYQKYVTRGLIVSVILAIVLSISSLGYILWAKAKDEREREALNREITLADLDLPPPIEDVPIELPKDVALKDLSALAPEPVPKKLVTEEVKLKNQKELEEVKLPVASEGTDDPSKVTATEFTGKVKEKKDRRKSREKRRKEERNVSAIRSRKSTCCSKS